MDSLEMTVTQIAARYKHSEHNSFSEWTHQRQMVYNTSRRPRLVSVLLAKHEDIWHICDRSSLMHMLIMTFVSNN